MAKLIFIDRDFAGQVYKLAVEKTTVGRGDSNTLVLRHETVSAHHCEILANDPEVIVRDLGSRNGTFVNGVRFTGQRQVKSGQSIRFGHVEARLELDRASADDSETDETAVRLHHEVMRDAAAGPKSPPAPQPAPQPAITASPAAGSEEQTILVPQTTSRTPAPASPIETTPVQASRPSKASILAAVGIGVVALIALLWWLLTRH
jgi:predicted component of type VI protein secretion system